MAEPSSAEEIALHGFRSAVRRARYVLPQLRSAQARYRNPKSIYGNPLFSYWMELKHESRLLAKVVRAIRQEK